MIIATSLPDFMMSYNSVASTYRVYVVFTKAKIPVWTPLLRLLMRYYQGSKVEYTHCLLVVQNMLDEVLVWHEMDYYEGMAVYESTYDSIKYDGKTLTVSHNTFYGGTLEESYNALDVTSMVTASEIEDRWERFYTDTRLTPWSLLLHLTPAKNKVTWTCSGIVQALLTNNPYVSYVSPKSPDQLYTILTTQ